MRPAAAPASAQIFGSPPRWPRQGSSYQAGSWGSPRVRAVKMGGFRLPRRLPGPSIGLGIGAPRLRL